MADPVLVSTGTPYGGFTLAQIVERLLATRGLTEDATTGRTVATTDESAQARVFIRRAVGLLNAKWPSIWSIRETSGTWIAGDSMLAVPSNCKAVLYFIYDGIPLTCILRDDELRNRTSNIASGAQGPLKTGSDIWAYRVVGYTAVSVTDNRQVIRVYSTPPEAKAYIIGYNAKAAALTSDTDSLPMLESFQEWVLIKARELWATELNDTVTKQVAMTDMERQERDMIPELEGMLEAPRRFKWHYPNRMNRFQRGR